MLGVAPGGVDHDVDGAVVRAFPGLLSRLVPGLRGEPAQHGQQRTAEHPVVLLTDSELAVRAPELLQVGHEQGRVVPILGDADQGAEEALALHVHGGREHRPDLVVHGEQLAVEIGHGRVGDRLEGRQRGLSGIAGAATGTVGRRGSLMAAR